MMLSFPGMHSGRRLLMFSTLYYMKNQSVMNMFAVIKHDLMFQLQWIEKKIPKNA